MGSLSQPRLNLFTVDNMGVMICLGQGGLRSLSASSCIVLSQHPLSNSIKLKTMALFQFSIMHKFSSSRIFPLTLFHNLLDFFSNGINSITVSIPYDGADLCADSAGHSRIHGMKKYIYIL